MTPQAEEKRRPEFLVVLAWVLMGAGVYNLVLGAAVYDFHPVSLIGGALSLVVGLLLYRRSRRRSD